MTGNNVRFISYEHPNRLNSTDDLTSPVSDDFVWARFQVLEQYPGVWGKTDFKQHLSYTN